jgi:hypothetical protein
LVPVSERLRDVLLSLDPTGKTVLEVGCGRGGLLLELVQGLRHRDRLRLWHIAVYERAAG